MKLSQWANRHGVSDAAMQELRELFMPDADIKHAAAQTETGVNSLVRLEATNRGARLWRNNNGVAVTESGRHVRYGLANDSAKMNTHIKSSDLIGLKPVLIRPEMAGLIIGQFVARECKRPTWKYTGTARERAQLRYLQLVAALGGDACFTTGGETL